MLGERKNKLRIYKQFKQKFKTEQYVLLNIWKKYHSHRALSMFRDGVASINVELLRYGVNKKPEEERFCMYCNNTIENECHVPIKCPLYEDIRNEPYNNIPDLSFFNISDDEKICCKCCCQSLFWYTRGAFFDILEEEIFNLNIISSIYVKNGHMYMYFLVIF